MLSEDGAGAVDKRLGEVICRDEWESLGPGKGVYVPGFGGFAFTSLLNS